MNKKRLIGMLVAVGCLVFVASFVYAEDLTKYYNISSPEYVEIISYTRQQPAFYIIAPKGWYVALANSDEVADRAIFFKSDPEKVLSEGHIQTPNIRVSFAPNPQGFTAFMMTSDYASQIKSTGGQILLEPQDIYADKLLGSHFTALDPKSNIIMDIYIFRKERVYISLMAICSYVEFDGLKAKIKESVDSIKF
ncbi:hypothetical protein HQ550_04615 [bacterium]|nr:hypothetical protein [bacterium]